MKTAMWVDECVCVCVCAVIVNKLFPWISLEFKILQCLKEKLK